MLLLPLQYNVEHVVPRSGQAAEKVIARLSSSSLERKQCEDDS